MRIKNGSVFGTDHQMHECDLCFENGIITEKSASGEYDATGCFVLPGFIDTHIHGAYGVKFYMQDGNLTPALDWLSDHGVTSILVTLCTEKLEEYLDDIKRIKEVADDRILGIHAEGPFVNPVRKGGMMWDRIQQPDCEIPRTINEVSGGMLRILSLAPELEGAEEVICGSAICLADGAKKMFDLGFGPEEIAVMACVNPAKVCGCSDRGELALGKRADIVILDSDFRVKDVFVAGVKR